MRLYSLTKVCKISKYTVKVLYLIDTLYLFVGTSI